MSGADIAAIITAAGGAIAAVLGGVALVRKKSGELGRQREQECEDCFDRRRTLLRLLNKVLDLLAEHGIPEPEGIRDELGPRRPAAVAAAEDQQPAN